MGTVDIRQREFVQADAGVQRSNVGEQHAQPGPCTVSADNEVETPDLTIAEAQFDLLVHE